MLVVLPFFCRFVLLFLLACACDPLQADPILTVSISNVNLAMPLGASAAVSYTITNSSNQALTGLTVYPPALTQVTSNTCGNTLAPGALCTGKLLIQSFNRGGRLSLGLLKVCAFGGTVCAVADSINNQIQTNIGGVPFVYATEFGDSDVFVVNARDNIAAVPPLGPPSSTIDVGSNPNRLAVAPNGLRLYVANATASTVSVISTQINTAVATVNLSTNIDSLVVAVDSRLIYAVGVDTNLHIINATNNQEEATFSSGLANANKIAITPDGRRLYIGNTSAIRQFDLTTNQNSNVPVSTGFTFNTGMTVSPDGTRLYITENGGGTVPRLVEVDTADNSEIRRIPAGSVNGQSIRDIVISPDGQRIYVSNQSARTISVIDPAVATGSNPIFQTPPVVGTALVGLALSSDGRHLYTSNFNGANSVVNVIDTALMSAGITGIIAQIPATTSLQFIATTS